ncbi:beta-glucosidase [Plectosphaerella plurivora]|uniref:Beta-glucosidase cel3A n=1 Tax=Plectosphaerella plurivora TaxID=936078 RepID=A0A9P8VLM4_9PEZI|nr:beta-glucosidase [Plectosphaerella plurivora]
MDEYYKTPATIVREHHPSALNRLRDRFPFLYSKKGIAIVVGVLLLVIGGGLAGLAALPRGESSDAERPIADDSFFYGLSPPTYPSPEMVGLGEWKGSLEKAKDMVGKLTLEEKVSLTGGVPTDNGCVGKLPAVSRVGFPGMCLHDAGQGVRQSDFVSAFPAGIHVGASWNRALARERAIEMGWEFRRKGVNVLLGPQVGPMGRIVRGGRNWESFSVDPYLTGALVRETVEGVQGVGVMTSTKHFIGNEQETHRRPTLPREAVSSNIDDKTMHEFYLWPFADAVKAGAANIMCSYQRVNNSYGCQNSKTINGLLKTELGFQGWLVSDWDAQHAGVATAEAGMDVAMPVPHDFWGDRLVEAVRNGSLPEARVDDMVTRLLASWYHLGQDEAFPDPGVGMAKDLREPHDVVDARNASSRQVLLNGAVEGHVLVKNTRNALPLKKPRLLSIFGYSAKAPDVFNTHGGGFGDSMQFGAQAVSTAELEAGFTMDESFRDWSTIGFNGTIWVGGGSGATSPSTFSSPLDALKAQADEDGTAVYWDFQKGEPGVHPASDACLVMGNAWASESYDRPALDDEYTDNLIRHVAARCNNTIVVLHNAGVRLVDRWIENDNVTAVIFAHLPGEASGKALVSLLYGRENPSGKLPYTIARNASDYGGLQDPDVPDRLHRNFPQSNFTEGVYIDYRHFDREDVKPRFEFGFGLSYTSFEYGNLTTSLTSSSGSNASSTAEYPVGPVAEGGQRDLWDVLARVSANVRNTGSVDGAEVAQLYIGIPESPVRQLRGFEKPFLAAGETQTVTFELTRRDLSVWDVEKQQWRLQRGTYRIWVGGSSRDLPLDGKFDIGS